ncbi:MAG: hypothetical protein JNL57_01320 [Bacteroidetes bacterium]|nr:hypothetical protein [Bacteroidota bacterium]
MSENLFLMGKHILRFIAWGLTLPAVLNSCQLSKHRYTGGFHLEWRKTARSTPQKIPVRQVISSKTHAVRPADIYLHCSDSCETDTPGLNGNDTSMRQEVQQFYTALKFRKKNHIGSVLCSAGAGIFGSGALVFGVTNALGQGFIGSGGTPGIVLLLLVLAFIAFTLGAIAFQRAAASYENEAWIHLRSVMEQLPAHPLQSETVTEMVLAWLKATNLWRNGSVLHYLTVRRQLRQLLKTYEPYFTPEQWGRIWRAFRISGLLTHFLLTAILLLVMLTMLFG